MLHVAVSGAYTVLQEFGSTRVWLDSTERDPIAYPQHTLVSPLMETDDLDETGSLHVAVSG